MPKYGINKVILLGNLGTAPELRYLESGIAVCNFRMATTERFRSRDGTWNERTDWHNIVLWRKRAELAEKFLRVGSGVYVEGRIVTRSWEGEDGQKRYKTEVEVDKMRLLDGPPEGGGQQQQGGGSQPAQHPPAQKDDPVKTSGQPDQDNDDFDDDLPF